MTLDRSAYDRFDGDGLDDDEPVEQDCPDCNGYGWEAAMTADPLPSGEPGEPYQVQQACSSCGGSGKVEVAP